MLKYNVIKQIADQHGLGAAGIIALSKSADTFGHEVDGCVQGHPPDTGFVLVVRTSPNQHRESS